jgi:hypothetical protein
VAKFEGEERAGGGVGATTPAIVLLLRREGQRERASFAPLRGDNWRGKERTLSLQKRAEKERRAGRRSERKRFCEAEKEKSSFLTALGAD